MSKKFPQGQDLFANEPNGESMREDLVGLGEEPPTAEELAASRELASLMDSWLGASEDSVNAPSLVEDSMAELGSYGLLLRHAAKVPVLEPKSRERIEAELMEIAALRAEPRGGWSQRWQSRRSLLFQRPAWAALAAVLFLVGGWQLSQSLEHSPGSVRVSGLPSERLSAGQRLFGGTLSKPSKVNPFERTKSASERLDAVTDSLRRWQRQSWDNTRSSNL